MNVFQSGILSFGPGIQGVANAGLQFPPGVHDARALIITGTVRLYATGPGVTVLLPLDTLFEVMTPGIIVELSGPALLWAPELPTGARVQVTNETRGGEILNAALASEGLSHEVTLTADGDIQPGDILRLRATYESGGGAIVPIEALATASPGAVQFFATPQLWVEYTAAGVDGGEVTECARDGQDVIITAPGGTTTKVRIAAFIVKEMTTAEGIRAWFGALTYLDAGNARVSGIRVHNALPDALEVSDAFRLTREGGSIIEGTPGPIEWINADPAFLLEGASPVEMAAAVWDSTTPPAPGSKAADLAQARAMATASLAM